MAERAYNKVVRKNPYLGLLPCLFEAVRGRGFCKSEIGEILAKIPKGDYPQEERDNILQQLYDTSLCKIN